MKHTADGREILHQQEDGWNMLKPCRSWDVYHRLSHESYGNLSLNHGGWDDRGFLTWFVASWHRPHGWPYDSPANCGFRWVNFYDTPWMPEIPFQCEVIPPDDLDDLFSLHVSVCRAHGTRRFIAMSKKLELLPIWWDIVDSRGASWRVATGLMRFTIAGWYRLM